MQIGKAASTLPLIRAEFGADVGFLSLYLSVISVVAAVAGLAFGLATRRIGLRRAASAGLLLVAAGSLAGAFAPGPGTLLASRLAEAFGFVLCTSAFPALVRSAAPPHQQSLAMGLWATWMPVGVALSMALSFLLLDAIGWRGMFVLSAIVPVLALAALRATVPAVAAPRGPAPGRLSGLLRREVILMAASFAAFSSSSLIYLGFLPTILVDVIELTPPLANLTAFLAVLFLLPTNLLGGRLLDRGASPGLLLVVSFAVMGLSPVALLSEALPLPLRLAGMVLFAAAAGVPPAVVWSAIPRLGRQPGDAPILSGLFYQCAAIGQIVGPIATGLIHDAQGSWWSAVWCIAALSLIGMALGAAVGRPGKAAA